MALIGAAKLRRTNLFYLTQKLTKPRIYDIILIDSSDAKIFWLKRWGWHKMTITGTNISMVRGDSEALTIILREENGDQIDFEDGDTVYFTMREALGDTVTILQKVVVGFLDGEAVIEIEPADTSSLFFKTYVYDIQWTRADGQIKTIVPASDFTILAEVTYD
jgi:hypothetical protein